MIGVPVAAVPTTTPRFFKTVVPAGRRSSGHGMVFPVEDPRDASRVHRCGSHLDQLPHLGEQQHSLHLFPADEAGVSQQFHVAADLDDVGRVGDGE